LLVANKFQTGFDQPLLCGMYVDKRLGGIQAVQTLSRLNRKAPGKTTTYVLDFVNKPDEVLEAFKTYHTTAHLAGVTDPNLIFDLRAKLDTAGFYDDFEVDRVVAVQLNTQSKQGELVAALEPVADRLLKRFTAAKLRHVAATESGDETAAATAKDEMDALRLFKADAESYVRLYTFLSQIFNYGNTAVEKRWIFFRCLLPLLEFGRERQTVDLSKVALTHHNLKNRGKQNLPLALGDVPGLKPIDAAGSGSVQEREKALLSEIIERVNDLFEGELSEQDKLVYVNNVLLGKLLESEKLQQQACNNSKEQFAASPDLNRELVNAIMGALDAHTAMSTQALNSPTIQAGLKAILLNYAGLWEALRRSSAGR
jgi:type I restriction enzyme R subunit